MKNSRNINSLVVTVISLLIAVSSSARSQTPVATSPTWDVYPVRHASPFGGFSPRGGATFAIRQALDNAKSSVLVQAYSFTSVPIAEALVKAHRRGVKVQVLLDKSQKTEKYSSADFLANAGISTKIDAAHAIAHNKVMIIDKEIVITGSFNFSKAAEEGNAENLLVIRNRELASRYIENWELHEEHCEPYRQKAERKK